MIHTGVYLYPLPSGVVGVTGPSMSTMPQDFLKKNSASRTFLFPDFAPQSTPKALIFIVFDSWSALGNCFVHMNLQFVASCT